jgi:dihydroxyacetone kinase
MTLAEVLWVSSCRSLLLSRSSCRSHSLSLIDTLPQRFQLTIAILSGAIFSIFLASLTYELRSLPASTSLTVAEWGPVAARALAALQQATPARIGHRTMMDSLSPFVDTLANTLDLSKAVEACRAGADSTIPMTAKLGRATYVGTGRGVLPPDPGSKAVEFIVVGMEKALRGAGIV